MTKMALIALFVLFLSAMFVAASVNFGQINPFISAAFHLLGGFLTAMLIASFYNSEFKKLKQHLAFLTILGMTLGVGLVWEFTEYAFDQIAVPRFELNSEQPIIIGGDLDDTIQDLFMDNIGAIIFLSGLHLARRQNAISKFPSIS